MKKLRHCGTAKAVPLHSSLAQTALVARGEVTFTCPSDIAAVIAEEVDRSKCSVRLEIGRDVGESVLAAQLFLDFVESAGHLFDRGREHHLAARVRGELGQDFSARWHILMASSR